MYKSLLTKHSNYGAYVSEITAKRDSGLRIANNEFKSKLLSKQFRKYQRRPKNFIRSDSQPDRTTDELLAFKFEQYSIHTS